MRDQSLLAGLLSPEAATLYERLLSGTSPAPLSTDAATSPDVRELVEHGFLQRTAASERLALVAPEQAVEHQVLARQHHLTSQLQRLSQAREDGKALQEVYERARLLSAGVASVDVFTDPEQVSAVSHDVWIGARHEAVFFHTSHFRPGTVLTDERSIDLPPADMLGRVRMRAVYERAIFDIPGTLEVIERSIASGIDARVAATLPLKMMVVDAKVSLLPLDPCAGQVVRIRSPVVASAHLALFEHVWQRAVPLGATSAPEAFTATQRSVLAVVATGMKDDAAARQLGMSTRTLRRHVTALQDHFQVDNRVALAVAAAQEDLL